MAEKKYKKAVSYFKKQPKEDKDKDNVEKVSTVFFLFNAPA